MIINPNALIATLLGIACGVYFVTRYQKYLIHLVCSIQLVIDTRYTKIMYGRLESQSFLMSTANVYNLLPQDTHIAAINLSRNTIQTGLQSEYKVVLKEMIFQIVRLGIIPLIVSYFLQESLVYIGSLVLSITVLTLYQVFIAQGPNFLTHTQNILLLRHAYSYAKATNTQTALQPINPDSAITTEYIARHQQRTPVYQDTELPINPVLIANHAHDDANEDALEQVISGITTSEKNVDKSFRLSWQRMWWGNDVALCAILIGIYWLIGANSFDEYIFGAIQIIVLTQLFFVPVWAVITIAIKLLSKESI